MIRYFIIIASINICFMYASEQIKHSSSFDTCPGLLFKSTDIAGISRDWEEKYGTWTYSVRLKDTGTATCKHDPSKHRIAGQRVPAHLIHQPEYYTNSIKPDVMKPGGWPCFTAYKEQYELVELAYKEQMARLRVSTIKNKSIVCSTKISIS